jgi:hypothetical protein
MANSPRANQPHNFPHLRNAASGLKSGFAAVGKFARSVAGGQQENPQLLQQQQKEKNAELEKNIAYNTVSNFIERFTAFQLTFEFSRDLILHFSKFYEFENNRVHLLLSELERRQKSQYTFTRQDRRKISQERRRRRA